MKRLITFSSSVALERVPNDWGLILHDFSTLFTQWSLNISRKVFASKMGWPFSVRTSFSKELISFIKKGLTKFQNALLQTFLGYYLKVYFYSNIFANTHNCSFFWIDASLACLVFHVTRSEKFFFPFHPAHFCFKCTDTLAPASSAKFNFNYFLCWFTNNVLDKNSARLDKLKQSHRKLPVCLAEVTVLPSDISANQSDPSLA